MEKDKVRDIVKQKFTEYLTAKGCRKTPERYAILDLIYTETGHFDMDALYETMHAKHFRVSRATLYNTMQLLLECNLVIRHQFGTNLSYYERAYNNEFHLHLICTTCNAIQEYKDSELTTYIQNKKVKRFIPSHHSLYIFGTCNKCNMALKKRNKKKTE